jgi:ssDNA-binding replication factor A large subunit
MPIRSRSLKSLDRNLSSTPSRWQGRRFLAYLVVPAALTAAVLQAQSPPPGDPNKPYLLPEANRLPDVNDQMEMREALTKRQNFAAANAERKKQIADDSARLIKLTEELKAEASKTDKDMLSLNVIRMADEIERMAHNIKEKMKLMAGNGS